MMKLYAPIEMKVKAVSSLMVALTLFLSILQKILKYFASQPNTKNLITSKLLILIFKYRQHLT
jgi:hypothetical protein